MTTAHAAAEPLLEAADLLGAVGRDDLSARVRHGAARVLRPSTVVCVVGEFKQGKSSLVNALVSQVVCPVDDDLATSVVTVVQHAPEPAAVVIRHDGTERRREPVRIHDLARFVTEAGNPNNEMGVEQVAIGIPAPILAEGLVLVDTPGVGGLGAGHAAATLAFLPYADAVILVSDASAELSAPELAFVQRALELGPQVVLVLTKTDLHPAWRVISDRNRQHLTTGAPGVPLLPVSADAALRAAERDDDAGLLDSGIAALCDHLRLHALDASRQRAASRAVTDAERSLATVRSGLEVELAALDRDVDQASLRAQYDDALRRLEHLRGPGARWGQRLADGAADLNAEATQRFRASIRELNRTIDDRIEELDSPEAWDELGRSLQTAVAESLGSLFRHVDERFSQLEADLYDMVQIELASDRGPRSVDLEALIGLQFRKLQERRGAKVAAGQAFGLLRGAQTGLLMLGMFGRFVPAGAAALLFSNPVTLVLAGAFVGKAAMDQRKRTVAERRVKARQAVRQYLDDVQFNVSAELTDLLRQRQRELRDTMTDRVAEAARTVTEVADRARAALQSDAETTNSRRQTITEQLAQISRLLQRLNAVVSTGASGDVPGRPEERA